MGGVSYRLIRNICLEFQRKINIFVHVKKVAFVGDVSQGFATVSEGISKGLVTAYSKQPFHIFHARGTTVQIISVKKALVIVFRSFF